MSRLALYLFIFLSPPAYSLDYEQLKSLIEQKQIKTISSLLSSLPTDYRSEYVVMQESKSLQGASRSYPRIILFGQDAKLMMAFNGLSTQNNYDKLEIIQFREKTASFDLFEIQFPEAQNGSAKFSQANPGKCLKCHTSDARPNWEHYNQWPGALMGDDDRGSIGEHRDVTNEQLEEYRETFPKHDRYKYLEKFVDNYKPIKYPDPFDSTRPTNQNIKLTQRLFTLNFLRVARLLEQTPHFDEYKYAIVASLACPPEPLERFLPESWGPQKLPYEPFGHRKWWDFRSLFMKRGISVEHYYPGFKSERPFFSTPRQPGEELAGAIVLRNPSLQKDFPLQEVVDEHYGRFFSLARRPSDRQCQDIKTISRQNLAQVHAPEIEKAQKLAAIPKSILKCMQCHTDGPLKAPEIAFDDPSRLKLHLKVEGYPRGRFYDEILFRISEHASNGERMPPIGSIGEAGRKEIKTYLESISMRKAD